MAQKFLFETSFESQDIAERETAIPLALHEASLKVEYEKGLEQGRSEAQAGIDARNTEQLQDLQVKLLSLLEEQKQYRHKVQILLGEILKKSLEKLFPALAKTHGLDEILHVVSATFQKENPGKEMIILAHPETVTALSEKIATLADSVRFNVQANADLSHSDCQITWEGGGIERLSSRLYKEIEICLDRLPIKEEIDIPPAYEESEIEQQETSPSAQIKEHDTDQKTSTFSETQHHEDINLEETKHE